MEHRCSRDLCQGEHGTGKVLRPVRVLLSLFLDLVGSEHDPTLKDHMIAVRKYYSGGLLDGLVRASFMKGISFGLAVATIFGSLHWVV